MNEPFEQFAYGRCCDLRSKRHYRWLNSFQSRSVTLAGAPAVLVRIEHLGGRLLEVDTIAAD